jgi:hypothetical protein
MMLSDIKIIPCRESPLTGRIEGMGNYIYEIYGPFGQGCNIRVAGGSGTATLQYNWRDGADAEVRATSGRYTMSEESINDSRGNTIFRLAGDTISTSWSDGLLISLFAVNHHFARKTGPFLRRPPVISGGA